MSTVHIHFRLTCSLHTHSGLPGFPTGPRGELGRLFYYPFQESSSLLPSAIPSVWCPWEREPLEGKRFFLRKKDNKTSPASLAIVGPNIFGLDTKKGGADIKYTISINFFTKHRYTLERGISTEILPSSDWPVANCWDYLNYFITNNDSIVRY